MSNTDFLDVQEHKILSQKDVTRQGEGDRAQESCMFVVSLNTLRLKAIAQRLGTKDRPWWREALCGKRDCSVRGELGRLEMQLHGRIALTAHCRRAVALPARRMASNPG